MALTITQSGLNKAVNASNRGVNLKITHVALGTSGYQPSRNAKALQNEISRVAIAGGTNVAGNQIHLTAVFDNNQQFSAKEIGFFLEDGTLFALESDPNNVLIYKNSKSTIIEAFDLILDAVPPESITVDTTGSLSLYYAKEFTTIATSLLDLQHQSIKKQFEELEDQKNRQQIDQALTNRLNAMERNRLEQTKQQLSINIATATAITTLQTHQITHVFNNL